MTKSISLTDTELEQAARGARALAHHIRQNAERHKGGSTYEGQIREAAEFEALAKKFEDSRNSRQS